MSQSRFFHQSNVDAYGAAFAGAIAFVLGRETEFNRDGTVHCERDPDDPGGTTEYGIDAGSHPGVDVAHLTEAAAVAIYHRTEWTRIQGDRLPTFLALPLLDTAVNPGIERAGEWLQQALGFQGEDVDGQIGKDTWTAAGKLDAAGLLRVALAIQDSRANYYRARPAVLNGKPFRSRFLAGWLNRVDLTRRAISAAAVGGSTGPA